ncbi:MAG: DUF2177 family protein [Bdellovibrionota bacterium]|mgnify:CR=1 FL=1
MIRTALICFVLFVVFDSIWFSLVTKNLYLKEFANIGRIIDGKFQILYWAAALVYLLLSIGLAYFVFSQFDENVSLTKVFLSGALFGLVCYGVYDMTNLATLKDFSIKIAVIDVAWGTFVCGAVTALTYWISTIFK